MDDQGLWYKLFSLTATSTGTSLVDTRDHFQETLALMWDIPKTLGDQFFFSLCFMLDGTDTFSKSFKFHKML